MIKGSQPLKFNDFFKDHDIRVLAIRFFAILTLFLTFSISSSAASNESLVYQGRIVRPDGSVPSSGSITFTLSVYSPAPSKCLLYSETQVLNMSGANGMFSLALGEGSRTDGGAHPFKQIFVNGGTLSGLTCASGATSYAPAATDDRSLVASFNDAGVTVQLSAMNIKSIPFALQAHQIGGYGINDLIKVHPTTGSATTFTAAEMAVAKVITGLTCANNEIIKYNGTTWACSSDATGGSPSDASYLAKGVVQFDTNAATSGLSVASGVVKLSDVNSNVGTFGSATKTVTFTVNAQGRITAASHQDIAILASQITQSSANNGEVLKWNGTAWAPAADATGTSPGDATYAAKGLVQGLTDQDTSGLKIASGVISVNAGTGANQIVKLNGSSQLPAVDGSLLTNLSVSNISTGVLPIARGGTNNGSLGVTAGGILYMDGSKAMTTAAGTSGQALISAGSGAPAFGNLGVGAGGTGSTAFTANSLIIANGTGSALTGITCTPGQILKWNAGGTAWECTTDATGTAPGDSSYTAKGVVQFDTDAATSGVSVTSGVAKVNVGTGANQIVKLNGSSQLPAVDGSLLTNLSTSQLTAGTLPITRGGTNSATALTNGKVMVSSSGAIVEGNGFGSTNTASTYVMRDASGNFAAGAITNDSNILKGATTGTLTMTVPTSVTSYTLTWPAAVGGAGSFLTTDASGNLSWGSPAAVADASYAAKGAVQGLTNAATSGLNLASGVISVNSGTGANQIVKLDGSAKLPAVDGSALTNLTAANLTGAVPVANGGTGQSSYSAGDLLYATGATATSKLGIGANGTILTSTGSAPQWSTVSALGFFVDGGNTVTGTATLGTNSNHNLEIETNGSTKMTIEAAGDVGIGTDNPVAKLHLHKPVNTGYTEAYFTSSTSGVTATDGFTIGVSNSNSDAFIWNYENAILQFGTNNQERMRINASGEVGIGKTATAGTKLEIQGSGTTSPVVKLVRALGHPDQALEIHPGDSTTTHHYITGRSPESLKKKVMFSSLHNGGGTPGGDLGFVFRIGPDSAPVAVINILESGYMGVGDIVPTSILDINGSFTQRGMAAPSVSSAGQGRIYFDSTSNKFRVSQNGAAYVDLVPAGASDASYASKGVVQGLTDAATSGLNIASGVISVNAGTGANQIVKLNGSSQLPALDGSLLTNLSAANFTAGTLPVGRGGTGATTLTSNGVLLGNGTSAVSATAAGAADTVLRVPAGGGAPAFGAIDLSKSAAVTGTLGIGNGGTGRTAFDVDRLVGTNGAGALVPVTCNLGEVLSFNASGVYGCYNIGNLFNGFIDGGNTFTADATIGTNSNHKLTIETNNTPRMTLDTSGFVGIGTTSPITKLHTRTTSFGPYSPSTILAGVSVENDIAGNVNGNFSGIQLHTHTSGGVNSYGALTLIQPDYTSTNSELAVQLRNAAGTYGEVMRINSSGRVGIGTATPSGTLHLWGTGTNGAESVLYFGDQGNSTNPLIRERLPGDTDQLDISAKEGLFFRTSGTDRVTIDNTGNVGIGTTTPGAKLHVHSPSTTPATWKPVQSIGMSSSGASATYNAVVGVEIGGTNSVTGAGTTEAIGTATSLGGANDANGQSVTGHLIDLTTHASDFGNGLLIRNQYQGNSTGGTQYGIQLQLTDTDVTNYGVYQTGAGAINYFQGKVGVGNNAPAASAIVDIASTTKGFLIPRMLETERDAITSPATGLQIYNTNTNQINFYNGTAWTSISAGGAYLSSTGGTLSGNLALGTNSITSVGSITGDSALTVAAGGTNQNLTLSSTGTGSVNMTTGTGTQFSVLNGPASTVNYVTVRGAAAGGSPVIGTAGADANIDLTFTPKGTGNSVFSSGKVGVGTSSPVGKFNVAHTNVSVDNGAAANAALISTTDAAGADVGGSLMLGGMYSASTTPVAFAGISGRKYNATLNNRTGYLQFATSNSAGTMTEAMRVYEAKLGIGSTLPNDQLHVMSPGAASLQMPVRIQNNNSSNGAATGIAFKNGTSGTDSLYKSAIAFERTASNGRGMIKFLNSSEDNTNNVALNHAAMSINYDGRVGIGTTTMDDLLDIRSISGAWNLVSLTGGQEMQLHSAYDPTGDGERRLSFYKYRGTWASPTAVQNGDTLSAIYASGYDGADGFKSTGITSYVDGTVAANRIPGRLDFETADSTGNLMARMTIRSDGYVGIGTTGPTDNLTIGSNGVSDQTMVINSDTTNKKIAFTSAGNYSEIMATFDQNFIISSYGGSASLTLNTNSADRLKIDQDGKVGIGTSSAARTLLDVNGAIAGKPALAVAGATVNFAANNLAYTTQNCGSFQLDNMKDGASYTFAVQGTVSALCAFTAYSGTGTGLLTVKMPPDHGMTTGGKETLYTFVVLGSRVYVSWVPGY